MKTYHHGDKLRLKRTPLGPIRASNRLSTHDTYVSPGEIGTVTRTPYTTHDGTPMASWSLEFDRGRRIGMTVPDGAGYAESRVGCFYDYEDRDKFFTKV